MKKIQYLLHLAAAAVALAPNFQTQPSFKITKAMVAAGRGEHNTSFVREIKSQAYASVSA